ncbi:hypothetical protein PWT90_05384 [Aphanocladium album]|nr:hypothetical protein PWT90_05384 [Aphanocladium album]
MKLLDLSNELIIYIVNCLENCAQLSQFSRTNRYVHALVMPLLYQRDIRYGKCSGLKALLTPLEIKEPMGRFFSEMMEDLEEYRHPSQLTAANGLPMLVTEEIYVRDAVIGNFVKHGANLDALDRDKNGHNMLLLHDSAMMRDAPSVYLLVKHGADIHATSRHEERTALHWAAVGGCAKIISFLIQKGSNVNAREWSERTPLHFAAQEGHAAAIRILVENGAYIDAQDEDGCTPLHLMMMNGKPAPDSWCMPALRAMLEASPNTKLGMFEDNKRALHVAILNQRDLDFIKALLKSGMDLNSRTVEGRTPLSCCVERGDMETFMMLVEAGADICTTDEDGRSLLQIALEDEDRAYACLPTLLEEGLFTLSSNAGDGKPLARALKERDWVYTIEGRVAVTSWRPNATARCIAAWSYELAPAYAAADFIALVRHRDARGV